MDDHRLFPGGVIRSNLRESSASAPWRVRGEGWFRELCRSLPSLTSRSRYLTPPWPCWQHVWEWPCGPMTTTLTLCAFQCGADLELETGHISDLPTS